MFSAEWAAASTVIGTASAGTWGNAEAVPGLATLNFADVSSVSCASPDNCSAGGVSDGLAFLVDETNGTWGNAEPVPGLAALVPYPGTNDSFTSISCASPGNCSAGGSYFDSSSNNGNRAFVVSESKGVWGTAEQVPGLATLNGDGSGANVSSVSCASPGNCSAGGVFFGGPAFLVDETHGTWGNAEPVPGLTTLGPRAVSLESVSCASPGNCSAGGSYWNLSTGPQAFVVSESHGV
jgi:hypothetical protein